MNLDKFPNPNEEQNDQVLEPEVLDAEPKINDDVPEVGNYNRDELRDAIDKARE